MGAGGEGRFSLTSHQRDRPILRLDAPAFVWTAEFGLTESAHIPVLSADLQAAQARLMALRQAHQATRPMPESRAPLNGHGRFPIPPSPPPQLTALPAHLGWHSPAVTAVLRHMLPSPPLPTVAPPIPPDTPPPVPTDTAVTLPPTSDTLRLYPDLAAGMLRANQAAPGRVWLLLRHLDRQGVGWYDMDMVRHKLTDRQSPWWICGWRQLRNLLRQGEGIFWQQQQHRLWLRSMVKAAAALDVWRLSNRPVALPLSVLTQGMGTVRAHLYASFHSGRNRETSVSPIARATLQRLTFTSPRTQRRYERRLRLRRQVHFALGEQVTPIKREEAAWQHGPALFLFTDFIGRQGAPGKTYLAWQLPNSYVGPHQPQPRGRQRRINRELADLWTQGTMGNDKQTDPTGPRTRRRLYYRNGKQAAQAADKRRVYWPHTAGKGRFGLWFSPTPHTEGTLYSTTTPA